MGSPTYNEVSVPQAGEAEILAAPGARSQRRFLRVINVDPTNFFNFTTDGSAATITGIKLAPLASIEWKHPDVPQGQLRGLANVADAEAVIEVG